MCVCVLCCVWRLATPQTRAGQAPPSSIGFPRQKYWSGLPFPSPGDLPNPGIEPGSPTLQANTLISEPPGKPADGDCSHEIKRRLLLGRKVMTNLDSIFKSRDITLPTKVHLAKAMVFPVVVYGCESWTVKKAKCRRIDAFELWCWRRLLRVPWTARRSNQSILKEISPGISLEGMMLKLKLQYFGHLIWRVDSLEKTLMLGGIEGRRKRGWQRMRWLDGIWLDVHESEWTPGVGDGQGGLACCDSWGRKESDMTERLNWTEYRSLEFRS